MPAVLEEAPVEPQVEREVLDPEHKPYVPPIVRVGDVIYWHPDGLRSSEPTAGIVCQVGIRAIKVVLVGEGRFMEPHMSVHHVDDPELKDRPKLGRNNGAWSHHPLVQDVLELKSRLSDVEALLDAKTRPQKK